MAETIHSLQVVAGLLPSNSKIIYVGDGQQSHTFKGTMLLNSLAAITDASIDNPYLIKLEPGVYDLGASELVMKPYVDIEGTGSSTVIRSSRGGSSIGAGSVITGADNMGLFNLSVESLGGGTYSVAIYNNGTSPTLTNIYASASGSNYNYAVRNVLTASPKMTNVQVHASGGSNSAGVYNSNESSPVMHRVHASVSGGYYNYGIRNINSSAPDIADCRAIVSGDHFNYGIANTSSSTVISRCQLLASGGTTNYGIFSSASPEATIVNTKCNGIIVSGRTLFVPADGEDIENGLLLQSAANEIQGLSGNTPPGPANRYIIQLDVGGYDTATSSFQMLEYVDLFGSGRSATKITSNNSTGDAFTSATVMGADNSTLHNLTIENRGGGARNSAIINLNCSPRILEVDAVATNATTVYAIFDSMSGTIYDDVNIEATGSSSTTGMRISSSTVTLNNVTISASGGGDNYGIYNVSSVMSVRNSVISGSRSSIASYGAPTSQVAMSQLLDSVEGAGFSCVGVYDAGFNALNSTCQ